MARLIQLAAFFALVALTLSAGTIVNQPTHWTGNGTDVGAENPYSAVFSTNIGYRSFDDFSSASTATVNQVSWAGFYVDNSLNNEAPNTANWDIGFFADNANAPGALLSDTSLPAVQVTSIVLGTGLWGAGGTSVTLYEFTAAVTPFQVSAGTTYWFSPLSETTDLDLGFVWAEGAGGNDQFYQYLDTNGTLSAPNLIAQDLAFTLVDAPETNSYAMMCAGIGLLVWLRHGRKSSIRTPRHRAA